MKSIVLLLLLCCTAVVSAELTDPNPSENVEQPSAKKVGASIIHLMDFHVYQRVFHKHYRSASEQSARLLRFIARSLEAVSMLIRYVGGQSPYYLTLNKYSDRTDAELRPLLSARPDVEVLKRARRSPEAKGEPDRAQGGNLLARFSALLKAVGPDRKAQNSELLNWSRSGCISEPEDQGDCGCCYAMASVKFFEWLYCRQQEARELTKFSAQFILDCGHLSGLNGCVSGSAVSTMKFIQSHGLVSARQRPYLAAERQCPPPGELQVTRVEGLEYRLVRADGWEEALREQPLIAYLKHGEDFLDYGGGVYRNKRCAEAEGGHFALLVGHGVEGGQGYWLFANSFGRDWGLAGYFKMSRQSGECIAYGLRPTEVQVRGLSGSGRLELPCLVDQANCGEVYYITWTRQTPSPANATLLHNHQQQWSRVYLYTGANDSSPHKPMGGLLERATFAMPDKSSSPEEPPTARLIIEQPRLADEALYKCDVTYVKGKCPSISLVRVHMLALPSKAQIIAQRLPAAGALPDGQLVGPYNELEQLRLACLVHGGRPQPKSVIWRKIDAAGRTINLAPARFAPSPQPVRPWPADQPSFVQVDLNHTLTSADLGARFECHVEHEAMEQPARVLGEPPAPGNRTPDAMLDLHPARPTDADAAPDTSSKSLDSHVVVDLNVGVASLELFMSKVNKHNSSEPLNEGDLVELECVAYNSKPPANITWLNGAESIEQLEPPAAGSSAGLANTWSPGKRSRNKRLLQRNQVHQNPDGLTYTTHSFLSIKLSRHEHRAQISCQAQNEPMQQPIVKKIELQVQHAPIVLMEPAAGIVMNEAPQLASDDVALASGANDVSVYCIYSANPTDLLANSTRWFKDGQPLDLSGESQHYSESLTATGYPVLNIRQVKRHHAGLYDCQLTNAVGSSERLAASEACKLSVNFKPSVKLRLLKPPISLTMSAEAGGANYPPNELLEVDLSQELILPGGSFVLQCDVLEAQPGKIQKFHWFRRPLKTRNFVPQSAARALEVGQVIGVTESGQFALHSLAANFSAASFACAAFNSLGASNQSNQIELQLSYTPGPSYVRHVTDAAQRRSVLASGGLATQASSSVLETSDFVPQPPHPQHPLAAGRELLLECVTSDLGQPSANIWLWFRNGQPIESPPALIQSATNSNNPSASNFDDSLEKDNPIATQQDSSALVSSISRRTNGPQTNADDKRQQQQQPSHSRPKLIASGRYLYIPSIQLAHKGNYSCVAVNRFGSGQQQPTNSSGGLERDSYHLRVALAPSFVQPLPSRIYWPEVQPATADQSTGHLRIELVCHVQCEPICQIEWLRNNEPLDLKKQSESVSSNYVTYQVRQSIMDENLEANLFKSIESTLVLQLQEGAERQSQTVRDTVLQRRHFLNGSNYTCQSSPNSMGHPVRSTTKFIVQYPPENVLISAPSDKLSLVEGSNGPRLSCEAFGEPRVQYRWFLLKSSSNGGGFDLPPANVYLPGRQHLRELSSSSSFSAAGERDQAINQVTGKAFHPTAQGANDALSLEQDAIELTSSATSDQSSNGLQGTSGSTLDLSNLSLDRRQSGYYFCEASNRLGQTRQSVYVNVQYKPACATLHLHSLDLTIAPSLNTLGKLHQDGQNKVKPLSATENDEYSLVRETSEDFIDLRKILVLSPLLNRNPQGHFDEGLSFKNSIFQTILNDKKIHDSNVGKPSFASTGTEKSMQLKDKNALLHDDKSDITNQNNLMLSIESGVDGNRQVANSNQNSAFGDSWEKFNILLLKFLNNYMKQVKSYEEQVIENNAISSSRQSKRSSQANSDKSTRSTKHDNEGTKNLITFACMAQDANPMSNLSFDWSFGTTTLPITEESILDIDTLESKTTRETAKPILIYSNEDNYTVNIWLVRRFDTKASLNPFVMSLLTLDVVIAPTANLTLRARRQSESSSARTAPHLLKAPVGKNRYQSTYNNLKDNQINNNIQFTHELDLKPYTPGSPLEVTEQNWQEEIGNLLRCTVSNSIGTSEQCNARINLAERLKSQSSSTEFARWRMPDLAHRSLLIISTLIGFTFLIFVTFSFLLSPYVKSLLTRATEIERSKEETNTGQSTCSQKSSVLGLLGNGDSSTQGSSDDDISTKMNHDNGINVQGRLNVNRSDTNGRIAPNTYLHQDQQLMRDLRAEYDRPRNLQSVQVSCSNHQERAVDGNLETSTYENYAHLENSGELSASQVLGTQAGLDSRLSSQGSAGSRLLANLKLKSLTKFKTDRIADLTNFTSRLDNLRGAHSKDSSSSETNTTGLSAFRLDSERSMKLDSPSSRESPSFFTSSSLRYNSSSFRLPSQPRVRQSYYYDQNGLSNETSDSHMLQLSHQRLPATNSTYSNIIVNNSNNAMDEFIRKREVDSTIGDNNPLTFYRAHSVRNPHVHQPTYMLENNHSQFYPQHLNRGPLVYPRTQQDSDFYGRGYEDTRPTLTDRSSLYPKQTPAANPQYQVNNSYSIAGYNQSLGDRLVPLTKVTYMDTIDSHLNRLTSGVTIAGGLYPDSSQNIAYANTIDRGAYGHQIPNDYNQAQNTTTAEHIYDNNTYATPEQTPLRRPNSAGIALAANSERPRVSQLIQTFNSKAPE